MSEPLITTPVLRMGEADMFYRCDEFSLCEDGIRQLFDLETPPPAIRLRVWAASETAANKGRPVCLMVDSAGSRLRIYSSEPHYSDYFTVETTMHIYKCLPGEFKTDGAELDVYVELEEITEDE